MLRSTTSGGPYTVISAPGAVTGTTYTDTNVVNGTSYYYVVTASNSLGDSGPSNEANATPTAPPSAPPAPTNLNATGGNQQVSLTWSTSTGATSYNVKRSTTSGTGYTTIATGVTTNAYTNTGLANGTTYYYVVSAVNAGGESPNSAEKSATTTNFTLSATPSSRSVARGGSTTYSVSIARLFGFASSVSLSVSGLPRQTSASFSPASIANPGTAATLTIPATGGGITRSVNVTLVVN